MATQHPTLNKPIEFMLSGIAFATKPTTHEEYAAWNDSFRNKVLDCPLDLITYVASGYAFTNPHLHDIRKKDNWRDAQYIAIDLEKHPDAALDAIERNEFFQTYGFASYTTYSHTDEAPRARAIFILDQPVEFVKLWHCAARAIMGFFGAAADRGSVDISRAFHGNPDMDCRIFGNILPWTQVGYVLAHQQMVIDMAAKPSRHRDNAPVVLKGASLESMNRWLDELRHTSEGARNNTLNRIAFLVGRYIVAKNLLDETAAVAMLVNAAVSAGLEEFEAIRTATQSVRKGATL